MTYNPEIHHRQSIRLKDYDYSKEGAYFFTICTYQRIEVFGEIIESNMHLNDQGEIMYAMWQTLPKRFPNVELDAFITMPNHVHGIVVQSKCDSLKHDSEKVPFTFNYQYKSFRSNPNRSQSVHETIRAFKALISYHVHRNGNPEFAWQRGFYEHIIRNVTELDRIRSYIINNPAKWQEDKLHPLYLQNKPM